MQYGVMRITKFTSVVNRKLPVLVRLGNPKAAACQTFSAGHCKVLIIITTVSLMIE